MEAWLVFSTIALGFTVLWSVAFSDVYWDTLTGEAFRESKKDAVMTVLIQAYTLVALSAIPAWFIYLD